MVKKVEEYLEDYRRITKNLSKITLGMKRARRKVRLDMTKLSNNSSSKLLRKPILSVFPSGVRICSSEIEELCHDLEHTPELKLFDSILESKGKVPILGF